MHTRAQIEIIVKKKRPAAQRQLAGEATGQVEAHLLQDRVPRGGGSQATPDSLPQLPATATQLGRNQILPASSQKPRNQASTQAQRDEGRAYINILGSGSLIVSSLPLPMTNEENI